MDEGFSTRNGHTFGFWVFGMTCYHGVVLLANLKVLNISSSFSPFFIISILGSYTTFVMAWIYVSEFSVGVLQQTFYS